MAARRDTYPFLRTFLRSLSARWRGTKIGQSQALIASVKVFAQRAREAPTKSQVIAMIATTPHTFSIGDLQTVFSLLYQKICYCQVK